jgi:hypothetical protein
MQTDPSRGSGVCRPLIRLWIGARRASLSAWRKAAAWGCWAPETRSRRQNDSPPHWGCNCTKFTSSLPTYRLCWSVPVHSFNRVSQQARMFQRGWYRGADASGFRQVTRRRWIPFRWMLLRRGSRKSALTDTMDASTWLVACGRIVLHGCTECRPTDSCEDIHNELPASDSVGRLKKLDPKMRWHPNLEMLSISFRTRHTQSVA